MNPLMGCAVSIHMKTFIKNGGTVEGFSHSVARSREENEVDGTSLTIKSQNPHGTDVKLSSALIMHQDE